MTQPIYYPATTARHALPLLVPGQAQKEFFVNEAFARIDMLLCPNVEGELAAPPTQPVAGQCWIVAPSASGAWLGQETALACWDGTQWTFAFPQPGQTVYDRSTDARLCFAETWQRAILPASPQSGTTVDTEARAALTAVLEILRTFKLAA